MLTACTATIFTFPMVHSVKYALAVTSLETKEIVNIGCKNGSNSCIVVNLPFDDKSSAPWGRFEEICLCEGTELEKVFIKK